ncbi:hypothetical protein C8R43DRAFT_1134569 [Mycena crocata]|nr:hypothetical protein C8R43DRAFT_1134569 [Mycena crocata]
MVTLADHDTSAGRCPLVVFYFAVLYYRRKALLPPSPKGLPLIGDLFDVPNTQEWLAFIEMSQKYGAFSVHYPRKPKAASFKLSALLHRFNIYHADALLLHHDRAITTGGAHPLLHTSKRKSFPRLESHPHGSRYSWLAPALVAEACGLPLLLPDASAGMDNLLTAALRLNRSAI